MEALTCQSPLKMTWVMVKISPLLDMTNAIHGMEVQPIVNPWSNVTSPRVVMVITMAALSSKGNSIHHIGRLSSTTKLCAMMSLLVPLFNITMHSLPFMVTITITLTVVI